MPGRARYRGKKGQTALHDAAQLGRRCLFDHTQSPLGTPTPAMAEKRTHASEPFLKYARGVFPRMGLDIPWGSFSCAQAVLHLRIAAGHAGASGRAGWRRLAVSMFFSPDFVAEGPGQVSTFIIPCISGRTAPAGRKRIFPDAKLAYTIISGHNLIATNSQPEGPCSSFNSATCLLCHRPVP